MILEWGKTMDKNMIKRWSNDLIETLKENDVLYILGKYVKTRKNKELSHLVRSYYQPAFEGCVYFLEHPGTLLPNKTIYDISVGETEKKEVGFCAEMHHLLYKLMFADEYNLSPRVVWGCGSPYYEAELEKKSNNAFEYYFEAISEASDYSLSEFANIIKSDTKHILKYHNMILKSYYQNEQSIRLLAKSYKKHIRLNEYTNRIILEDINHIFQGKNKLLGIHARGGDFKQEFKKHPHHVFPEEYLEKAKEEFASGKYEQIFLATDDENILKMFIDCFGDKLLYYNDVPRVSGNVGIHVKESSRPLHHYKLGLELLRDVYTLVACSSFICGLSHVSFMVRYIKESLDEQFEKVIVLDKGINK